MAVDADDSVSRTKAAAWAWYQRSGGGASPSLGRSEAFASRCYTRRPPSRFKLEAAQAAAANKQQQPQPQPATDFMISSSSTEAERAPSPQVEAALEHEEFGGPQQLDLVTPHPSCWDCGSSLFDSFELVAMSKKLDVELSEPRIGSDDPQQQQFLLLCDSSHSPSPPPAPASLSASDVVATPFAEASQFLEQPPPSSSPLQHNLNHEVFQDLYPYSAMTPELKVSISDRHSKQAVYDMFCQYGDANKQLVKMENCVDGGDVRKHKPKQRMSFHSFAKALYHIAHLTHSAGQERYRQHHHHHHYSPQPHHQQFPGKALPQGNCAYGIPSTSPPGGDRLPHERAEEDNEILRHPHEHIHHHHHHHYHYLFHSDDDFRLQPLDKSLMVAAAGLRAPKMNPALSGYLDAPRAEYGLESVRKWADFGSVPASGGPIVQQWR